MIPIDFIPVDKDSSRLSQEELDHRFAFWPVFDYRGQEDGYGVPPEPGWNSQKLGPYLDNARKVIQWTTESLLKEHFVQMWDQRYAGFSYGSDGRKIKSLEDYHAYLQVAHAKNPEEMRSLREKTYYVCYEMWTKSHFWAVTGEKLFMEGLGWEYSPLLANGSKMKRNQRGACVKQIMVKRCGEKTDSIRSKYEEIYNERM